MFRFLIQCLSMQMRLISKFRRSGEWHLRCFRNCPCVLVKNEFKRVGRDWLQLPRNPHDCKEFHRITCKKLQTQMNNLARFFRCFDVCFVLNICITCRSLLIESSTVSKSENKPCLVFIFFFFARIISFPYEVAVFCQKRSFKLDITCSKPPRCSCSLLLY